MLNTIVLSLTVLLLPLQQGQLEEHYDNAGHKLTQVELSQIHQVLAETDLLKEKYAKDEFADVYKLGRGLSISLPAKPIATSDQLARIQIGNLAGRSAIHLGEIQEAKAMFAWSKQEGDDSDLGNLLEARQAAQKGDLDDARELAARPSQISHVFGGMWADYYPDMKSQVGAESRIDMMLAQSVWWRDGELKRMFLDKALRLEPKNPAIMDSIARDEIGRKNNPRRGLELLKMELPLVHGDLRASLVEGIRSMISYLHDHPEKDKSSVTGRH